MPVGSGAFGVVVGTLGMANRALRSCRAFLRMVAAIMVAVDLPRAMPAPALDAAGAGFGANSFLTAV